MHACVCMYTYTLCTHTCAHTHIHYDQLGDIGEQGRLKLAVDPHVPQHKHLRLPQKHRRFPPFSPRRWRDQPPTLEDVGVPHSGT